MLEIVTPNVPWTAAVKAIENANEDDLRDALQLAIDARQKASERADATKAIYDRAEGMMQAAHERCARLKEGQEVAKRAAAEARAADIVASLKGGIEPAAEPAVNTGYLGDSDLAAAAANLRALEIVARETCKDHDLAFDAFVDAVAHVRAKASAVVNFMGMQILNELLGARDRFWHLEQIVSGFFLHDERQLEGPSFARLGDEVRHSLDRQTEAKRRHPEFLEFHRWKTYVDQLNKDAELIWSDFQKRLENDAYAAFDSEKKGKLT